MGAPSKIAPLAEAIAADIQKGVFGAAGERFLTIRDLAKTFSVSLESACNIMNLLADRRIIRLFGKNYYVTTGFVPPSSPLGVLLRQSRRPLLGMFVKNIDNPFFSSLAKELSEAAHKNGYHLIVASGESTKRETEMLEEFLTLGISGVFTCPGSEATPNEAYATYPLPLVSLGRELPFANCDNVLVDNYSAGVQVAKHLLSIGCETFAYVGLKNFLKKDPRLQGFIDRLGKEGATLPTEHIITVGKRDDGSIDVDSMSGSFNQLLHRFAEGKKVGLFCYHDLLAVEAMRLVKRHNKISSNRLTVPDGISIVGFDDLPIASVVTPPLTTVSYRYATIAERSMEIMKDYIHTPDHKTARHEVKSSLIVRDSTFAEQ